MSQSLIHRNRALCFVIILFCLIRQFSARNLPDVEESTAKATQIIHVSNATWHDFSRLVDVQIGSHVSGVSELKRYLHRFGYVNDVADGSTTFSDVFDGPLESAISLYQVNLGLPVTGRLDTSTVSLMSSPRCGVTDTHMIVNNGVHITAHYTYFKGKPKWNRDTLTFAISKTHKLDYLTSDNVKEVFRRAFGHWATVIPVTFEEVDDFSEADLKIGFYTGDHGDGLPFDGVLGTLAHAFAPGNGRLHLDAAETWVIDDDFKRSSKVAVDLESVATHEIGHLLGLGHSSQESAVMYPSLRPRTKKFDLTVDDVAGVLKLYGPNPNLQLDLLTDTENSLKNGAVSGRFLPGNLTSYVLLVVVLILFV